jgi:formate dehydrogenase iron-sulfur subunit
MKRVDDDTRISALVDTTRCVGCRACQVACKQWNELPATKTEFTGSYENPKHSSGETWTIVRFREFADNPMWRFRKEQCFHCNDASCVTVCPTGAAQKRDNGIVFIDQKLCAGCKYCMEACPFQTPKTSDRGTAIKCRFCLDRVENGLVPACIKACPTGALFYGTRTTVLAELEKRRAGKQGLYTYGEKELGGLGWIYLMDRPPAEMGLIVDPQPATRGIVGKWLSGVIPGLAVLGGLAWLFKRKSSLPEQKKV